MGITVTQDAVLRSQCRQRFIEDGNCVGTTKERKQTSRTRKTYYFNTKTLTIAVLFGLAMAANGLNSENCPSKCSCTVETIVFCNNKGLTSTPTDFTSVVEKLYLFNNNITTISPRSLQPLKNLKILDISGNRITDYALWNGIFSQLKLLENLMLQENQIRRITSNMFKGLTNLARIYLQSNEIFVIESGAFDNLPNLVELKLRHNRLVTFPKFEHTPNLLLLDLGHNRLRTIRDMALSTVNVEHLLLQSNRLTQLRTSVFDDTSRLNQLDISNNRLTAIPQVVKSLVSLRSLNMSTNKMATIPKDTFSKLLQLKQLDLHGMGLKSLPYGIIPPRVILNVLDVTDNDWDCGCGTKWLPQYIRIFEQAFVNPDDLRCSQDSRLRNMTLKDLTEKDFDCTGHESSNTLVPPLGPAFTTEGPQTTSLGPKTHWSANPCDVFPCFNGGTCVIVDRHPTCKCEKGWAGQQCHRSLTTPTTTSTTTSRPTTTRRVSNPPSGKSLLINQDSVTENSVEIILPLTDTELLVSVKEIGEKEQPKEFTIRPRAHPFTVKGLESARAYNICIHLPLRSDDGKVPIGSQRKDTLCGTVKTGGIRIANTPAAKIEISVVPSPDVAKTRPPTDDDNGNKKGGVKTDTKKNEPKLKDSNSGEELRSSMDPDTTPTESSDFKILYPALGAGIGAVIITILLVMFFICYRQKRMLKLKQQNGPEYSSGSPVDTTHTDLEMATVVHHHHHNHYNAGGAVSNQSPTKKTNSSPPSKPQNGKPTFNKAVSHPNRVSLPNAAKMSGRSSSASSNSSGTMQSDVPHRYSMPAQTHLSTAPLSPMQYENQPLLPQMNGRGNEFVYRNHQNATADGRMPVMKSHCQPQGRPHNPRLSDDTQPLVTGMNQYHYGANDRHLYPVSPMNVPTYIPPAGSVSYAPSNSRSAFQPIQSPRNANVRTSPSEIVPIQARTAHVLPTAAACLNRNLMNENMPRYHEGVQVV